MIRIVYEYSLQTTLHNQINLLYRQWNLQGSIMAVMILRVFTWKMMEALALQGCIHNVLVFWKSFMSLCI